MINCNSECNKQEQLTQRYTFHLTVTEQSKSKSILYIIYAICVHLHNYTRIYLSVYYLPRYIISLYYIFSYIRRSGGHNRWQTPGANYPLRNVTTFCEFWLECQNTAMWELTRRCGSTTCTDSLCPDCGLTHCRIRQSCVFYRGRLNHLVRLRMYSRNPDVQLAGVSLIKLSRSIPI